MYFGHQLSQRFDVGVSPGLADKPGRSAKRSIPHQTVRRIIETAALARPGCQRWSTGTAATVVGVSSDTVSRTRQEKGLKPLLTQSFTEFSEKQFQEKLRNVLGLSLDPPLHPLVLCCDEKTQCRALHRTQPCLPLGDSGWATSPPERTTPSGTALSRCSQR